MFLNKKLNKLKNSNHLLRKLYTVFVLGVLILFSNNTNYPAQLESGVYNTTTVLKKRVELDIVEISRSDYTDALVLYFQQINPSPFENPFNGEELGKTI